ncbi:hypothetical protein J3R30DRAFT_3832464 [Lentinula aciculospora]|uniref:Uncharacterized protein n=1 Tax=Lentinula aciculospora TaxID=153920 RepID=A0A9W9DGG5_9AGAR|nr:hypothetical protein J3R30DRAFT_3832464 [Lentinula aciculospora]
MTVEPEPIKDRVVFNSDYDSAGLDALCLQSEHLNNRTIKDELVNNIRGWVRYERLDIIILYLRLTERPDFTDRLRCEILQKVGPNSRPTYEVIPEMKCLRAFINEILRLYPAVPFNVRKLSKFLLRPKLQCKSSFSNHRTTWNSVVLPQTDTQPVYYVPAGVKYNWHCQQIAWDVQPESSKPPASWRPYSTGNILSPTEHPSLLLSVDPLFTSCPNATITAFYINSMRPIFYTFDAENLSDRDLFLCLSASRLPNLVAEPRCLKASNRTYNTLETRSPISLKRQRKHPATPGSLHNIPGRENSPSPFRDRQRTVKTQSLPLVPTAAQIFAAGQQSYPGQQNSPTSSNSSRRSPPMQAPQVQRLLPTPPHPNPPNLLELSPERRMSPGILPPAQHQVNNITHYPRPINRVPPPQFLSNLHDLEQNWQMTDELMAEIERADLQQTQGMAAAHIHPSYPVGSAYNATNVKADSSPRDPGVERIRATGKSSPKATEGQLGRRPSVRESRENRESPKARDRPSFSPNQSQTPERRKSPPYHSPLGSPGEQYSQYHHEPTSLARRPPVLTHDSRPNLTLATQTPPLQAISARTPDKSLPLQEEPEEEITLATKVDVNGRDHSRYMHQIHQQREQGHGSPTPLSDLNPEGSYTHDGRSSRAALRPEDEDTLYEKSDKQESSNDGSGTPRSPSAGLPTAESTAQNRFFPQPNQPRGPIPAPLRGRGRNGSTDQLGLRGLDTSLFEQVEQTRASEQPPQYAEAPKLVPRPDPRMQESYAHYYAQHLHPDDLQSMMDDPTSAYIQAYLRSPRPDAPIPPTPHSQTSPPSPSPMLSGRYENTKDSYPPFSPVAPAGSPYPYPFTHVRRNMNYSGHSQTHSNVGLNPAVIQEQFVKQFQMYAQNHSGNITDSTLSPSTTPYPPTYNPWAYWHTQRLMGGQIPDPVTTQSSPSHEPIPLPPPMVGLRRKSDSLNLRAYRPAQKTNRKPPPRVDSTQPRETSPEPSTSGEETAGEETHFAVSEEGSWVNGNAMAIPIPIPIPTPIVDDTSSAEWVDEDEEEDEEDLLELEYHPTYVNNVEKRRRRWETRWDALLQAFQALDRQTDATMVLLAAPSHSMKHHLVTSRSIRRQPAIGHSQALKSVRAGFRQVAAQRRISRSHKASLVDRFLNASSGSGDGSDGSSESNKEDMKRVLDAALGSLNVMRDMYEQREARWVDEMRRMSEDRERVEFLLKQVLGDGHAEKDSVAEATRL